jgi:hypothetical protein
MVNYIVKHIYIYIYYTISNLVNINNRIYNTTLLKLTNIRTKTQRISYEKLYCKIYTYIYVSYIIKLD